MNQSNLSIKHLLAILCVFAALTLAIYSNIFSSPFILDDLPFILNDPHIRMTEFTWENIQKAAIEASPRHRPLPNISFAVNYYLGRYHVTGYHIVNITIHLFTGIILFFFFNITLNISSSRRTTFSLHPTHIAMLAAMIWLVHPIHTQAVTYTCQRMTSLAAMFYILSLFLYVKARIATGSNKPKKIQAALLFIGCLLAGLCAVASKENAAALPLFILLYEWFFFQDLKSIWTGKKIAWGIIAIALFGGIALIYLGENPIARIMAGYAHRDFTLPQRIMTEFRVVIYYISLIFWPYSGRLSLEHDYPLSYSLIDPWTTLLSLAAIIGLIGLAVKTAKKDRLISFCILWFFGNLIIESSVFGIEIIFEHRTYLPLMMVSLLGVCIADRLFYRKRKPLMVAVLCIVMAISSAWTHHRNAMFNDKTTFLRDCVIKTPDKIRPRSNLATTLQLNNKTSEAVFHFKKILQINPNFVTAYNNLGNIYVAQNKLDNAVDQYLTALKIDPALNPYHKKDFASVNFNLGSVLYLREMPNEAIFHYSQGLKINPDNGDAHVKLGEILLPQNQFLTAKNQFKKALQLNPENIRAKTSLRYLKDIRHQYFTAKNISPAKEKDMPPPKEILYPGNARLHMKLAALYQEQGKITLAANQYKKNLLLDPSNTHSLYQLGVCFGLLGQHEKSLKTFNHLKMLKNKTPR